VQEKKMNKKQDGKDEEEKREGRLKEFSIKTKGCES